MCKINGKPLAAPESQNELEASTRQQSVLHLRVSLVVSSHQITAFTSRNSLIRTHPLSGLSCFNSNLLFYNTSHEPTTQRPPNTTHISTNTTHHHHQQHPRWLVPSRQPVSCHRLTAAVILRSRCLHATLTRSHFTPPPNHH